MQYLKDAESLYNQLVLYEMSGTGNTYRVAVWLAEYAKSYIDDVTIIMVDKNIEDVDLKIGGKCLVGVLFPTHGFMPPWSMLKFLVKIKQQHGTDAFCIATRGGIRIGKLLIPGIAGLANFLAAFLLSLKRNRPRALLSLDMPSNFINFHWGLCEKNVEHISEKAKQRIKWLVPSLLQGKTLLISRNNLWEMLWAMVIIWFVPLFPLYYLLFGKVSMAKILFSNNRCVGCGVCAKFCPNKAISMWPIGKKKKPFWTYRCEVCLRCMGYCHKKAVEAGHSWGILLYFIISLPLISSAIFSLLPNTEISLLVGMNLGRLVVYLIDFYAALFISYWIFWILMRIPAVNAIFSYTTLTHYYRRYHQPQTKLKDLAKK